MKDKRIAILFAGQGAQTVGMGQDLAAKYPAAAALFSRADEILARPLSAIAFTGPDEELTQTKNCQPALFVHGLACLAALRSEMGELPIHAAAGLSLGEFTAHSAAGTFDFETGLRLVAQRGLFMQEACEQSSGGMAAMIGADESAVRALAGSIAENADVHSIFDATCAIIDEPVTLEAAMSRGAEFLERAATRAARLISIGTRL